MSQRADGTFTLSEAVSGAARTLEAADLAAEDSRRDAGLLARAVLGWDAARWLTHQRDPAPPGFQAAFDALVRRRAAREPVAYITGRREFYGREFHVTRDVLIPRPETEGLVEEALAVPWVGAPGTRPVIMDVGTGSGCLAVTLALEIPDAVVIATDTSPTALAIARENARRLGVADRIEFREGHLLAGAAGPIDLIVCNPPYVRERDRTALSPEVGVFEPAVALFGGPDGLDIIRMLLAAAAAALRPGGRLVMEIGNGQDEAVHHLTVGAGLTVTRVRDDLQGIPRVLSAQRSR